MSIAELAIRKGPLTWTLSAALLILGWLSFENLPRQSDPQPTVREVRVITPYPGASAASVEQEVSDKIEQAIQGLGELRRTESYSTRGLSVVHALIGREFDDDQLPQIRHELRERVDNAQTELPAGADPSIIKKDVDEPGAIYYALTGEGFSQAELSRVAGLLQRELSTLESVTKTEIFGQQQERILVEISTAGTKALGVGIDDVLDALHSKNLPADAGWLRIGPEQVPIHPSGLYGSEQDLGDLMIASGNDRLIRLDDVAEITRGYPESPRRLFRVDGAPAIGIVLSIAADADQADMDQAVERGLARLQSLIPLGMELKPISLHAQDAAAIDSMFASLLQALAIVAAALLLFMGLHTGPPVVLAILVTLSATFVAMDFFQLVLDRISLAALTIALGMIASNAIFVVEDLKTRTGQCMPGLQAAQESIADNALPLLAATAVLVLAFAPIGGMDTNSGEYARAFYQVMLIALPISWLASLTIAPLAAERLLPTAGLGTTGRGPEGGRIRGLYATATTAALRHRNGSLATIAVLSALSLYAFGFVKQAFFPPVATQAIVVEVYFRDGTHIRESERQMAEISSYLLGQAGVERIITSFGDDPVSYFPADIAAPDAGSHYALSLVWIDDYERFEDIRLQAQTEIQERFPDAAVSVMRLDPAFPHRGGHIQLHISGPDPAELRRLANQAEAVFSADPDAKAVRDDWGEKVKVAQPLLAQERARRMRIDRQRISTALRTAYSGTITGYYREDSNLIPIVARAPLEERDEVEDMADIQVTSPLRGDQATMLQLVDRLDTVTEDARRIRRNGVPTITLHADARRGSTFELLQRIKPTAERALRVDGAGYLGRKSGSDDEIDIETIPIVENDRIPLADKPGYFIAWGGEAERAAASIDELKTSIPISLGLAVLVTIALFNALRQPLIVLLTIPMAAIGVAAGLLLTGETFGFLSMIGVLGLSGMLMRNAMLLVDKIGREIGSNVSWLPGVLKASASCLRPIAIAAAATILAVLPLLQHGFFRPMAITISAGLAVGTLLSLIVVPALYAALFRAGGKEG